MTRTEIVSILSKFHDMNKESIRWAVESDAVIWIAITPNEIDIKDWLGGTVVIDKGTKDVTVLGTDPFTIMDFEEKNGPFRKLKI